MAIKYSSYFDKISKLKYDINRSLVNPRYETVTNIFFRVRFLEEAINNISSYYTVELGDGDTPEILAEKVYGDPGAFWMITIANHIIDPQWEWPLDYDQFNKYIIGKYGSIKAAQITPHHYEMVVTTTINQVTTERRYTVNGDKLTDNILTVPYNYYHPSLYEDTPTGGEFGLQSGSLAFTGYYNTYNVDGQTITEVVKGEEIMCYDYEQSLNESRRLIKVVKKEYYTQIMKEFNTLTSFRSPYQRRVF